MIVVSGLSVAVNRWLLLQVIGKHPGQFDACNLQSFIFRNMYKLVINNSSIDHTKELITPTAATYLRFLYLTQGKATNIYTNNADRIGQGVVSQSNIIIHDMLLKDESKAANEVASMNVANNDDTNMSNHNSNDIDTNSSFNDDQFNTLVNSLKKNIGNSFDYDFKKLLLLPEVTLEWSINVKKKQNYQTGGFFIKSY